jgi:hypothetical protein
VAERNNFSASAADCNKSPLQMGEEFR